MNDHFGKSKFRLQGLGSDVIRVEKVLHKKGPGFRGMANIGFSVWFGGQGLKEKDKLSCINLGLGIEFYVLGPSLKYEGGTHLGFTVEVDCSTFCV